MNQKYRPTRQAATNKPQKKTSFPDSTTVGEKKGRVVLRPNPPESATAKDPYPQGQLATNGQGTNVYGGGALRG